MKKTMSILTVTLTTALFIYGCNSASVTENNNMSQADANVNASFSGELPISPRIIKGKFDNGITYIIRKNTKPENRAELRLVINAGSVLEDDNQQGFAHIC